MVTRRTSMTTNKHLCIVFWDSKGLLFLDTLQRNETITAVRYSTSLDGLAESLRIRRRRDATRGFNNFHFLHDNAIRPHTAAITQQKLLELNFNVIPHPP